MLSAQAFRKSIGRPTLPETFRTCYKEFGGPNMAARCFVLEPDASWIPHGFDPSCRACVGLQYVKQGYQAHLKGGGEPIGLRTFRRAYVADNDFVAARRAREWADWML